MCENNFLYRKKEVKLFFVEFWKGFKDKIKTFRFNHAC
jgi:hypothetical protein